MKPEFETPRPENNEAPKFEFEEAEKGERETLLRRFGGLHRKVLSLLAGLILMTAVGCGEKSDDTSPEEAGKKAKVEKIIGRMKDQKRRAEARMQARQREAEREHFAAREDARVIRSELKAILGRSFKEFNYRIHNRNFEVIDFELIVDGKRINLTPKQIKRIEDARRKALEEKQAEESRLRKEAIEKMSPEERERWMEDIKKNTSEGPEFKEDWEDDGKPNGTSQGNEYEEDWDDKKK